ncbi:hypothetical protein CTI12_AA546930 [Artemisia annua]|uniref:Homologous recombination OB-fold protein OB-fold domain-containing protein n=1 Tax=Artemisia annua TaxID=35608 RepID=A0A2U1KZQ2_ARTAN|nr:hypothetical protein CTI12_AA546930 [Artemisia annua]
MDKVRVTTRTTQNVDVANLEEIKPTRIIPGPAGIIQAAKLRKQSDIHEGGVEQVIAIVKSCTPNVLVDLTVTLKDLSGTIGGSIHHKIIDEGGPSYGKDITVGAVLILAKVLVFSPKSSIHYINITMRNVVKIFHKDTLVGNGSGNSEEMIENHT